MANLSRCHYCSAYTFCSPLILVRTWHVHVAVCFECIDIACEKSDGEESGWFFPLHHAPLAQVLHALWIGNVWWDVGLTD
jgi:hypothetical protein